MSSRVLAVVAGVFFGIWPLLMNRSGQNGYVQAAAFSGLVFVIVAPFAFRSGVQPFTWQQVLYTFSAGIAGAIGLLAYSKMNAMTSREQVGWMFIIMVLSQLATGALYQLVVVGNYSAKRVAGLVAAAIAAWLLI